MPQHRGVATSSIVHSAKHVRGVTTAVNFLPFLFKDFILFFL